MPLTYKDNRKFGKRRAAGRQRKFKKVVGKNPRVAKVARMVASRVVSKALTRNLENKTRTVQLATLVLKGNTVYGLNPTYHLPQALSEADRVGDRIQNVRFRMHGTYHHRGVNATQQALFSAAKVRLIGAWVNTKWSASTEGFWDNVLSAGAGTNLTLTEIFKLDPSSTGAYDTMFLNYNRVTPVFDKIYTCQRETSDAGDSGPGVNISLDVKLGTLQYQGQSAQQFLKNNQFVVLMVAAGLNTESVIPLSVDFMGYFRGCTMLTFRDA